MRCRHGVIAETTGWLSACPIQRTADLPTAGVAPGWLAAFAGRFAAHSDEAAATGLVLPDDLETEAQAAFLLKESCEEAPPILPRSYPRSDGR